MIRELVRLRPDSTLGWLLRLPLALLPRDAVVRVRGGINQGAAWVVGASTHGCWLGSYEADQQKFLAGVVKPGMRIWDVGANAGFYTLAFARLAGTSGRVHAFEPLAENVDHLLAHLRLNRIGNATVVQAALGETEGESGFRVARSNSMGRLAPEATGYLVPTLTIDGFLARHPESRPDLLKIDVEGAESRVLAGGLRCLREFAPAIVLSLHGRAQFDACVATLAGADYELSRLDGAPLTPGDADCDQLYAVKRGLLASRRR